MKSQMSSFDVAAVVGELQPLVGLRVEKVFFPTHRELFFRLSGRKEKQTVVIQVGRALWAEPDFRQAEGEPPTFAMLLRKHLSGLTLGKVSQHGFDRVVVFEFGPEPVLKIVVELFGTGNVILVGGETIIQPLTSRSWKARDVKAGKEFRFPPESPNPLELGDEDLAGILSGSEKDLVRCLAVEVNLGGAHAEEVCKVLGRGKDEPARSMGAKEVRRMTEIIALFGETLGHLSPYIVLENRDAVDIQPFWLSLYAERTKLEFGSFCEAAKEYFSNLPDELPEEVSPGEGGIARLERQLEMQRTAAGELESDAMRFKEIGDSIYADYQTFEGLLAKVKEVISDGNWQAAKNQVLEVPGVVDFEPSTGRLSVRTDELSLTLDVRLSLNENATVYYDKAKKARHKLEGAQKAIAEAETELKTRVRTGKTEVEKRRAKKTPTKRFWFEKFRWFVSSEGNIVLGGRDAKSNDQVVKKHLKDNDIYAHADVQGAPSIVIKDGAAAGEATLAEACLFALCHSKAWKSKVGSGSAYWVKPDQVSKTPEPGEFLPRGAFVIRGKRNYTKKIDMRLAVGEINFDGERKIMCGPETAVAANAVEYFVIAPGEEERSDFAKRISEFFNVLIEEIDGVLPPGDVRVVAGPDEA
jgi:predicted ribosome quality control (RQC) complex YloA/Tae2 family protein